MNVIWVTRGLDWGNRFLRDGGLDDPLPTYEDAVTSVGENIPAFHRSVDTAVVRFIDPQCRKDRSGRPIDHEFVVWGELPDTIRSAQSAQDFIWPLFADEYEKCWNLPTPESQPGSRSRED